MALVIGQSEKAALSVMAQFVWIASFTFRWFPDFEYVEAKANWTEEICREGLAGKWARLEGLHVGICTFVCQSVHLPCPGLVQICTFLQGNNACKTPPSYPGYFLGSLSPTQQVLAMLAGLLQGPGEYIGVFRAGTRCGPPKHENLGYTNIQSP